MKHLTFLLVCACLVCSCDIGRIFAGVQVYDAPTCVEVNGEHYASEQEDLHFSYFPPLGITFGDSYFSMSYNRTLYHDKKSVDISLRTTHEGTLEIGQRYRLDVEDKDNNPNTFTGIYYMGKTFYATEGWLTLHDYDTKENQECAYVSGSFEFTASTEDGSETIDLMNGKFDRVPMGVYNE